MTSSRDALRAMVAAASNPKPVEVAVPGMGLLFVRVMTPFDSEAARRELEQHSTREDGTPKEDGCQVGRLLATVLCDDAGLPLYEVGNDADVQMLSKLPGAVNQVIFKAHRDANGIATTEDEAAALGKA